MFALRIMRESGLGGFRSEEDYRDVLQVIEKEEQYRKALKLGLADDGSLLRAACARFPKATKPSAKPIEREALLKQVREFREKHSERDRLEREEHRRQKEQRDYEIFD